MRLRRVKPLGTGPGWKIVLRWCAFAGFGSLLLWVAASLPAESLGSIHTIAIGPFGTGGNGIALRQRLVKHLGSSGHVKVVATPSEADAVLRGTFNIWPTGAVVIDPRSHSSRQTNYQGYLSIDLVDKENQSLWSYLVTPSRFRMGKITDDLADRAADHLLDALEHGGAESASAPAAGLKTHVALHAAGATLPAPLYLKWFESAGIRVSYDAVGSEAGISQLEAGKVDFAASDMPLTAENSSPTLHVTQVPTVLGGVVPIYNLPRLDQDLYLTPETLAGIYRGTIRKWNDPAIRRTNPGAHLPNASIAVIHRSDGSGTTFVWTSFLSLSSPEWKNGTGSGTHVAWPTGTGSEGSDGVAALVQKTPYSIGYVELIYAIQHQLNYAAIRNPSGRFVKADLASISAAGSAALHGGSQPLGVSILNAAGRDAYPISTFTWLLVPQSGLDAQKKKTVVDFLAWMLTVGQRQCSSLGYPPLPKEVAARALEATKSLQ